MEPHRKCHDSDISAIRDIMVLKCHDSDISAIRDIMVLLSHQKVEGISTYQNFAC